MKRTTFIILAVATSFYFGYFFKTIIAKKPSIKIDVRQPENRSKLKAESNMKIGAFSVSLNVKDLESSKQFYENLGFKVFGGGMKKKYLIMKNENTLIGLFQGMFKGNMLTFNPGWDENAKNIEKFEDIREIQKQLKNKNIKLITEADENTTGPASLMLTDPDGNVLLIDQHR
jgi:catechol-2,3-dioxygenase